MVDYGIDNMKGSVSVDAILASAMLLLLSVSTVWILTFMRHTIESVISFDAHLWHAESCALRALSLHADGVLLDACHIYSEKPGYRFIHIRNKRQLEWIEPL